MELHTRAKVISRNKENPSKSRTCCGSAAYRAGEKIIGADGREHNYTRKNGIKHAEIMLPANAPEWMKDRQKLWQAADNAEKRKDAQLFREFEVGVPNEFSDELSVALVRNFIKQNFTDNGMVADFALHDPKYKDGHKNKHIHIMLTLREVTPEGFGKKNREWNDLQLVEQWRESWANYCNYALEKIQSDEYVEYQSYAERGINKIPQEHMGVAAVAMERRGIETERRKRLSRIEYLNLQLERAESMTSDVMSRANRLDTLMSQARNINSAVYEAAVVVRQSQHQLKLNAKTKASLMPISQAYNTISMLSGEHDLKDFERERLKEAYSFLRRNGYDPTNSDQALKVKMQLDRIRNSNRELSQSRERAMNAKTQVREARYGGKFER